MKKSKILIICAIIVLICLIVLIYLKSSSNTSWIDAYIAKEKDNITDVWKCEYKNKTVYCFEYNVWDGLEPVYNDKGKEICIIGGIDGNGDGKCPDFNKNNCENIYTTNK